MHTLYPPIEPYRTFHLKVSPLHTLYVELIGNPSGIPILFLHGGPGSGLDPEHRRFFDPQKFMVVLFDQRGSGRSTPYAELEENTTGDLVQDIEKIRTHLGIDKWHVFGGSWGSFLALAYAEAHTHCISSLILRGLFLGQKEEIEFFYQKGASFFYPEKFEEFVMILSEEERKDVVNSFYKKLTSKDLEQRQTAARHWSMWEASCLKLINTEKSAKEFAKDSRLESLARIEAHYFVNGCFIKPNQLLDEAYKLKNIPITCVHGRYDLICPFENAYRLKKVLPHVDLHVAKSSGHSGFEPEILSLLLNALTSI